MISDKINSLTKLNIKDLKDIINPEKIASIIQIALFLLLIVVVAVTIKNGLLFYFSKDKIYLRSIENNPVEIKDQISLNWVQRYVEPKPKPKPKVKVKKQNTAPKVVRKPKRNRLSFKPKLAGIIYNTNGKGVVLFIEGSNQVPYLEGSILNNKNIKVKKINQHSVELEEDGYSESIQMPSNQVNVSSETDNTLPLNVGLPDNKNVNNIEQIAQNNTPPKTRTPKKQVIKRRTLSVKSVQEEKPQQEEEPQKEEKIETKVAKQVFERVLQDPSFLLKNVTIRPTKEGLSVKFNQNSLALANQLGLKQSDIIISVNSIPLDNPKNYFKLQQLITKSLRGNEPLDIVVKRAGQLISLKLNS